jgi:LacI family transcriptional regulator
MRSYRPAGWLIIPATDSELAEHLKVSSSSGQPVVCLDRKLKDWQGDAVLVANEEGAYNATKHLLRAGHKHLAVITGPLHLTNAVERLKGFQRALKEAKIQIDPEYMPEARFDRQSGYEAAMRLLRMLPRPTAIFACNDMMAYGVLSAARELNLRCPEDLSVVGFDNLDLTEFTAPALTTVQQPGYQLGATAARLLLERIDGQEGPRKTIVLPTALKLWNSVAPPGGDPDPDISIAKSPREKQRL